MPAAASLPLPQLVLRRVVCQHAYDASSSLSSARSPLAQRVCPHNAASAWQWLVLRRVWVALAKACPAPKIVQPPRWQRHAPPLRAAGRQALRPFGRNQAPHAGHATPATVAMTCAHGSAAAQPADRKKAVRPRILAHANSMVKRSRPGRYHSLDCRLTTTITIPQSLSCGVLR